MPGIPDYIDLDMPLASTSQAAKKRKGITNDIGMTEFNTWKANPDKKNMGVLLTSVQPMLDDIVRGYGDDDLLHSQARRMAIASFNTYDPAAGPLKTHISNHLQGLKRQAGQNAQVIHIPERVAIEHNHLKAYEAELMDELGRPPNDQELADRSGMPTDRITYVRKAQPGYVASALRDEQGGMYDPAVHIPGYNSRSDMWQTLVYHDLSDVDKLIMEHTLGMNGKETLDNATLAKLLGLSPGAVSQRKTKIQSQLDARYGSDLLGDE